MYCILCILFFCVLQYLCFPTNLYNVEICSLPKKLRVIPIAFSETESKFFYRAVNSQCQQKRRTKIKFLHNIFRVDLVKKNKKSTVQYSLISTAHTMTENLYILVALANLLEIYISQIN